MDLRPVASSPTATARQYLYYGSYYGGIFVTQLTTTAREAVGSRDDGRDRQQVRGRVRRAPRRLVLVPLRLRPPTAAPARPPATASTSAAPRDLRGPFVDRRASRWSTSRAGGTPVLTQNGNRWVGTGHNAVAHRPRRPGLDRLPRDRPRRPVPGRAVRHQRAADADRPARLGRRLADRAGRPRASASGRQPAPVTDSRRRRRRRSSRGATAARAGRRGHPAAARAARLPGRGRPAPVGDVAGRAGLVDRGARHAPARASAARPRLGALVADVRPRRHAASAARASRRCPPGSTTRDWHDLAARGARRRARPPSSATPGSATRWPCRARAAAGAAGAGAGRAGALALRPAPTPTTSASRAGARHRPVTRPRPAAPGRPGRPSDEFDRRASARGGPGCAGPGRPPSTAARCSGRPQAADLTGTGNDAGVLLRDAPGRRLDGRDQADASTSATDDRPQLPAGRAGRLRRRRPLRPALPRRDLEHPADRVRQGACRTPAGRPTAATHRRPAGRHDLAAADPPGRPGHGEHELRAAGPAATAGLDLGWRVDAARRHRPRGSGWSRTAAPAPTAAPSSTTSASTDPDAPAPAAPGRRKEHIDNDRQHPTLPGFTRAALPRRCGGGAGAAGLAAACGGGTSRPPGTGRRAAAASSPASTPAPT